MAKKNNENKVVYAALTLVLVVLSILVIVTGVASRRAEKRNDDGADTEKNISTNEKERDVDVMADPAEDPKKDGEKSSTGDSAGKKNTEKSDNKSSKDKKTKENSRNDAVLPPIIEDENRDMSENENGEEKSAGAEPEFPEFISPVCGKVSADHSENVLVYSDTMGDYRTHSGIDIATADSAVVVAAADGVISELWEDPMWGFCISIEHEGGAVSYYKNLSRESITGNVTGTEVRAGNVIGNVGGTALCEIAEDPHLHFELKINGKSVDPTEYFTVTPEESYED